tara:strand:+ start:270 stop:668 length:399 start_codon:yes stop_codon:yes gene_type:complete
MLSAKECILKFILNYVSERNVNIKPVPDGVLPSDHWEEMIDEGHEDDLNDAMQYEFRGSGEETNLPCDCSRHYESYTMARDLGDVSVAWTYWYGGGKHGEPDAIEWLDDAYFVSCEKVVKTVNIYSKIEGGK